MTQTTLARLLGDAAGLALVTSAVLCARPGVAQESESVLATAVVDAEALAERGTKRAAAKDTRAGHWLLSARSDVLLPAGSLVYGLGTGALLGFGPSFGATIGYGLSRSTVFEVGAAYGILTASNECTGCSGRSFDAGLGFSYHPAQGIAVDPWASFGSGYRTVSLTLPSTVLGRQPAASGRAYQGLDVARLAIGADFYPIPSLGFGPYLGADFGSFLGRPTPDAGAGVAALPDPGGATYAFFHVGLRIVLDPTRAPLVPMGPQAAPNPRRALGARTMSVSMGPRATPEPDPLRRPSRQSALLENASVSR